MEALRSRYLNIKSTTPAFPGLPSTQSAARKKSRKPGMPPSKKLLAASLPRSSHASVAASCLHITRCYPAARPGASPNEADVGSLHESWSSVYCTPHLE